MELVFLGAKRTPFGANGGSLKDVHPTELGVVAGRAALEQAGVEASKIDHVIFGSLLPSTKDSIYIPRHVGLKLGVPQEVPSLGINRLCGTGFQVVVEAYQQMLAGDSEVALVGGVENMSMAPYAVRNARWGMRMGNQVFEDTLTEALTDSYGNIPMAITAENLARQYDITREAADEFALMSQQRTKAALDKGIFRAELAPVEVGGKKPFTFENDEHPRPQTTPEQLAKLKPLFKKDGVVTAGNASGIVDGAAALVVATEKAAIKMKLEPLGRLRSYGIVGCDPKIMGIGPAPAARQALKKAGLKLEDMDVVEVNEAFTPQIIAVERELGLDRDRLNVNGGATAIGHPLAATGARITGHLLYELGRRKGKLALGSACIGGGQGIALIIERF